MGMFDYIRCEVPLPGHPLEVCKDLTFQTKDTDEQYLKTYIISADGLFIGPSGESENFTGRIEFYGSNQTGGWGEIPYTAEGEDAEGATYEATFLDGNLLSMSQTDYWRKKAITYAGSELPSHEAIEQRKARQSECLFDKRLYVLWGGRDKGYWVTVIAEDSRSLVVRCDEPQYGQSFEVIDRGGRDSCFFGSEADALMEKQGRLDEYLAEKARYEKITGEKLPA